MSNIKQEFLFKASLKQDEVTVEAWIQGITLEQYLREVMSSLIKAAVGQAHRNYIIEEGQEFHVYSTIITSFLMCISKEMDKKDLPYVLDHIQRFYDAMQSHEDEQRWQ